MSAGKYDGQVITLTCYFQGITLESRSKGCTKCDFPVNVRLETFNIQKSNFEENITMDTTMVY